MVSNFKHPGHESTKFFGFLRCAEQAWFCKANKKFLPEPWPEHLQKKSKKTHARRKKKTKKTHSKEKLQKGQKRSGKSTKRSITQDLWQDIYEFSTDVSYVTPVIDN